MVSASLLLPRPELRVPGAGGGEGCLPEPGAGGTGPSFHSSRLWPSGEQGEVVAASCGTRLALDKHRGRSPTTHDWEGGGTDVRMLPTPGRRQGEQFLFYGPRWEQSRGAQPPSWGGWGRASYGDLQGSDIGWDRPVAFGTQKTHPQQQAVLFPGAIPINHHRGLLGA